MELKPTTTIFTVLLVMLALLLSTACGIKVKEADAQATMRAIFKERKRGDITKELSYYAKKEFDIVPFEQLESRLNKLTARAGALKSITALEAKTQTRNVLGKGMTKYLILPYKVTYREVTVIESYYFLGSSEKPKLVYAVFEM